MTILDTSIASSTVARNLIDALISLLFAVTVMIALTGGFHFYIGAYLVSARSLTLPIGLFAILSITRVLLFGNPFSNFGIVQLKRATQLCLDLLAFIFIIISLFIILSARETTSGFTFEGRPGTSAL